MDWGSTYAAINKQNKYEYVHNSVVTRIANSFMVRVTWQLQSKCEGFCLFLKEMIYLHNVWYYYEL